MVNEGYSRSTVYATIAAMAFFTSLSCILSLGVACLTLTAASLTAAEPAPSSASLGHGVNLGNMLEAPVEGEWGVKVEEGYFPLIAGKGFKLIRVPIRWSAHVGPAPDYVIDPVFFARVDWVISQAEKNHLTIILDYHNDEALNKDPDTNGDRFVSIWKQIATHYKDAPASVLFELLNEPFGKLTSAKWNALLTRTLKSVRETNPTRTVVVGPVQWNSIAKLPQLVLPEDDRNLLVTFHFYDPFHFTHQGAEWAEYSDKWLGTKWGSEEDKAAIVKDFDKAAAWGVEHQRPIYLGEFGAYSKSPIEGRAQWTAFVVQTANAHSFPWTYWEFCSGFGVYDPAAKAWREPLLRALVP